MKDFFLLGSPQWDSYNTFFLFQNNKEGHVFLDVFAAEEYDPLHLNAHRPGPLKAVTKKLADPLLHLQDKHTEEEVCIALRELYQNEDI